MRFFSRVFLPLLLLGYIATETYLKLQNTSLCGEVGCKLAGELLKFNPLYLNYFGLAGLVILVVLGSLSLKNKFFEILFFMGIYAAIAFEATIISYQFMANPEPCIFCLSIFSSLLIIALFSQVKSFPVVVASVVAIFLGLSTLSITKNKAFVTQEGNYLIQSKSCSHCKKVKAYFSEHDIKYTSISVKEASARSFLKFVNVASIPVLIMKEKSGTTLLTGDKKILAYFENKTQDNAHKSINTSVDSEVSVSSDTLGLSSDFLSAGGADDGCTLSIVEAPSCADDNESSSQ
ncbi:MAG: glutaredoxin domain-containing protein [Sulfurovum sp.]|nr:glutaredoxin domain-containing protein [Sulfurovum sp.]